MNYQKIYNQIIERAKTRQLKGYFERHHIIPKCIGGSNNKDNLVNLTAREHFLCHLLLCEIYPDSDGLKYALYLMNIGKQKYKKADYNISNRTYSRLKNEHSFLMKGNKNCVGRWQSEETRKKISVANKKPKPEGFGKKPNDFGEKISKANKGKKRSKLALKRMSESKKGLSIGKGVKKPIVSEKNSKPILQYDLQGNFIKEWKSATDASKFLDKKSSSICECCKNKRKTAYGYKWKYKF